MTTITIKHWHQAQSASLQETAFSIWKLMQLLHDRSRQRHQLSRASADELLDMGISHKDAMTESMKPFWRS